jgi:Na+/proline symporter
MTALGWVIAVSSVGEAAFWAWILGGEPDKAALYAACGFFIVVTCARLAVALDRRLARWQA